MATRKGKATKDQADTPLGPSIYAKDEKDRLAAWRERITDARKARKHHWERFQIDKAERYYLGDQAPTGVSLDDYVVLNHLAATIETELPNLFYQQPKWFIRPTIRSGPGVEERARKLEAALEAVGMQDNGLKIAGKLAVFQSFFSLGAIEAIYDPQTVPNPDAGKPMYAKDAMGETRYYPQEQPPDPMQAQMGLPPAPHPLAGQPVPLTDAQGTPLLEPETILSDECFRFEYVDAGMMLLDDKAGPDPKKHRWIGKEVVMPLADAKADKKFNGNKARLSATEKSLRKPDGEMSGTLDERDVMREGFVRLVVCYDIAQREMVVLADDQPFDGFLFEGPMTPGLEDHPFAILGYQWILGPIPSAWPKPPVADCIRPQADYNNSRFLIREHAERILPKEGFDDSTFSSDEDKADYTSPTVGGLTHLNSTSKPPVAIQKPTMNDALVQVIPMALMDWRIITGQSATRMGSGSGGDTATEAAIMERAGNLRDSAKQDAINDWLSRAGRIMLKLLRKNMTFKFWVKLRGHSTQDVDRWLVTRGYQPAIVKAQPEIYDMIVQLLGESKWDEVSQEDLDFDAEVSVVPGSARARNLEVERKQWLDFLGILGNAPQIAMSRELLKETASKFETINDRMIDEIFAMSQKMLQAKMGVAGHAGPPGANGGTPPSGPPAAPAAGPAPPLQALLSQVQSVTGRSV